VKEFHLLRHVQWLGENRVRAIFSNGSVRDLSLPVPSAKRARIVHYGMGLDLGNGTDMCGDYAYSQGRIVRKERTAWLLSHRDYRLPIRRYRDTRPAAR
jgi:hypothetical protein